MATSYLQVKPAVSMCERGWGKHEGKGNTAQRCTDSRAEFKGKVSFLSVATGTSLGHRHPGMHV